MGYEFWSRLLAVASFAGTALISAWLIEYGLSEASSDQAYFVVAPLIPLLLAALGVAGTVRQGRSGEILAWTGALLLTLFFTAPGMIGPLYTPAALLMLIAAVLIHRASRTRAIASPLKERAGPPERGPAALDRRVQFTVYSPSALRFT